MGERPPYQGNPEYATADAWRDLLAPWAENSFMGDEYGDYVQALWYGGDRAVSASLYDKATFLLRMCFDALTEAEEYFDEYEEEVEIAQDRHSRIAEALFRVHTYPLEHDAIQRVLDELPDWMKSPAEPRPPKVWTVPVSSVRIEYPENVVPPT